MSTRHKPHSTCTLEINQEAQDSREAGVRQQIYDLRRLCVGDYRSDCYAPDVRMRRRNGALDAGQHP